MTDKPMRRTPFECGYAYAHHHDRLPFFTVRQARFGSHAKASEFAHGFNQAKTDVGRPDLCDWLGEGPGHGIWWR